MKKINLIVLVIIMICCFSSFSFGQEYSLKKDVSAAEVKYLQDLAKEISMSDQTYRKYLSAGTLDEKIYQKIQTAFDSLGIEEGWKYEKSLHLSLDKKVEDSLWELQHAIDLKNHLILRGIFNIYGFLPEELLGEHHYVQTLLLLHPPGNWDVKTYLKEYTEIFLEEVKLGRMPAFTFAQFFDNIKGKILKEYQLYGTNGQFDSSTGKIVPAMIKNLEQSNKARKEIGLPELKEGEYRISGD